MKPDTSNWRERFSYDVFDALSIEGLAWECLRRDEPYQRLYHSLVKAKAETEPLPQEAERRWGLRFPGPSGPLRNRPAGGLVAFRQSGGGVAHAAPRSFAAPIVPTASWRLHHPR